MCYTISLYLYIINLCAFQNILLTTFTDVHNEKFDLETCMYFIYAVN